MAAVAALLTLHLAVIQYTVASVRSDMDRHEAKWSHDGIGRELTDRLARIEERLESIDEKLAK